MRPNLTGLRVPTFSVKIKNTEFTSEGFTLDAGNIAIIQSSPSIEIDWLFQILSGISTYREWSIPFTTGNDKLERSIVELDLDSLKNLEINGKKILQLDCVNRSKHVGIVFNDPAKSIFSKTPRDEIYHLQSTLGMPVKTGVAYEYGLEEVLDNRTDRLSGGQLHRLQCLTALLKKPEIIFCDLELSNLDENFLGFFWQRINEECLNRGMVAIVKLPLNWDFSAWDFSNTSVLNVTDHGQISRIPSKFTADASRSSRIKTLLTKFRPGISQNQNILLEVRNLYCSERNLNNVSFKIKKGQLLMVFGENGSGKSTLGKILAGQRIAFSGELYWNGKLKKRFSRIRVSKGIVLQDAESSLLGIKIKDYFRSDTIKNLGDFEDSEVFCDELTNSKKKLLACISMIDNCEDLVILDEPTVGMDMQDVQRLIKVMSLKSELAILIITHDQDLMSLTPNLLKL